MTVAEGGLLEADQVKFGPIGRPARELSEPASPTSHDPAAISAVCNQRGSVGKIILTTNPGVALTEFGRKVLLVGLDPQGALSAGLGAPHEEPGLTVYSPIADDTIDIHGAIHHTKVSGLDLVPVNTGLSVAEIQLVDEVSCEQVLGCALHPAMSDYDFIIIDYQPLLGLPTVNVLTIAEGVIILMAAEYFSLRGLALLTDTVAKVRDCLNSNLEVSGIPATILGRRTRHARGVMERPIEVLGDKVFDTVITRTVRFPETSVAGESITTWAPNTPAMAQYHNPAHEVIGRKGHKQQVALPDSYTLEPSSGEGVQEEIIDFRVAFMNFNGPFDLLLQLISSKEMDVIEVALAAVTDEFISYVCSFNAVSNLGEIIEFLIAMMTLLNLKTARLLSRDDVNSKEDSELLEARDLLFVRLLQYQAHDKVADQPGGRQKTALRHYPWAVGPDKQLEELLLPVHLGMAFEEFAEFAAAVTRPKPPEEVSVERVHGMLVPVSGQAGKILDSLWLVDEGTQLTFTQLTLECRVPMEAVGRFLVLLELYRAKVIGVEQEEVLEKIHMVWTRLSVDPAVMTVANWKQATRAGCWVGLEPGPSRAGLGLVGLGWARLDWASAIS